MKRTPKDYRESKARAEGRVKKCMVCGKDALILAPSRAERTKFCSAACRVAGLGVRAAIASAKRKGKPGKRWTEITRQKHQVLIERRSAKALVNPIRRLYRGYIRTRVRPGNEIGEHRLIAEKVLGRPLKPKELVHHLNLDGTDNRPQNLVICTPWLHLYMHWKMQSLWAAEHFGGRNAV